MEHLQVGEGQEGRVMTPTERARRSDALYYDTESVARRCLCDMIANRESDLEDARAENAKLRELCADMLHDAMENICSKAHWCDEKSWRTCNDEKCGNRLYVEMARELGVDE